MSRSAETALIVIVLAAALALWAVMLFDRTTFVWIAIVNWTAACFVGVSARFYRWRVRCRRRRQYRADFPRARVRR